MNIRLLLITLLLIAMLLAGAADTGVLRSQQLTPAEKERDRGVDERKVRVSQTGYVILPEGYKAYHVRTWVDVWYYYIFSEDDDFRIDISGGLVQSPFEAGGGKILWSRMEQTPAGPIKVGMKRTGEGDLAVASAPWVNFSAQIKRDADTDTFLRIVRSYRQGECDDCAKPLPAPARPPAEDNSKSQDKTTPASDTQAVKVSPCELKKDPGAFNHKLVEITGFVSHGFEDFTLFDLSCSSWPEVWLEYGGTDKSGTMYCCGVTSDRSRPKPLVVENITVPLIDDARFREFDRLIQRRPDSVVRATILGRFFAGEQVKYPRGTSWGGYGHMGCCSLLAIQQIVSVDPQDRSDLDYGASADQPHIENSGCGYKYLTPIRPYDDSIKAQREAELRGDAWAFDDPQRVAVAALARLLGVDERSITGLKETRRAQGRVVFGWQPPAKRASYMVVASRPYWLSFYAKDPRRVAWVVAAAYESSCGSGNSVTRVR